MLKTKMSMGEVTTNKAQLKFTVGKKVYLSLKWEIWLPLVAANWLFKVGATNSNHRSSQGIKYRITFIAKHHEYSTRKILYCFNNKKIKKEN